MGREASVLLLQLHEGLLGGGGLLGALLHQALHAGQGRAAIGHAALQCLQPIPTTVKEKKRNNTTVKKKKRNNTTVMQKQRNLICFSQPTGLIMCAT